LLELLALHVDSQLGKEKDYNLIDGFKSLLQIVQGDSIDIFWPINYKKEDISVSKAGRLIVDPANPTNNVAAALPDWSEFQKKAKESLEMINKSQKKQ